MGYKLGYHILVLPNQVLLINSVLTNEVLLCVLPHTHSAYLRTYICTYDSRSELLYIPTCRFIDLSNASFSFDVEHPNSGRFSIVTPTNKYQLMAQNRDTMRFWLDQLQVRRGP